jgi:ankyrin repeat protein
MLKIHSCSLMIILIFSTELYAMFGYRNMELGGGLMALDMPTSKNKHRENLSKQDQALREAIDNNDIKAVHESLKNGADINSKCSGQFTPLQSALLSFKTSVLLQQDQSNIIDIIVLLSSQPSIDINAQDFMQETALFTSIPINSLTDDHIKIIKLLLHHGADPKIADNASRNSYDQAQRYHPTLVPIMKAERAEYLAKQRALVTQEVTGTTPLPTTLARLIAQYVYGKTVSKL